MTWILAAFSLGILGSLHCIGMCGPIALALPVHQLRGLKKQGAVLVYNLGRAITYACFGLFFGLLGQGFYLGGFQQTLSIAIGVVMISILFPSLNVFHFPQSGYFYSFINGLKLKLKLLFSKKGVHILFFIGVLNGFLPCGLLYFALAGALATGNYLSGAVFMFCFGLGTLPAMMAVTAFGQFISTKKRNAVRKLVPYMVAGMGALLVLRGLNLGIPYISPCTHIDEAGVCEYAAEEGKHSPDIFCSPKTQTTSVISSAQLSGQTKTKP